MPKPVRQQILDAVATALATVPGLAGDVQVNRAGRPDRLPRLSVEDQGDELISEEGFATRFWLRCRILGDTEAGPDLATSATEADVTNALNDAYQDLDAKVLGVVNLNRQWGGLASLTKLGNLEVEVDELASPRTATTARSIRIQYATLTGDPYTAAS